MHCNNKVTIELLLLLTMSLSQVFCNEKISTFAYLYIRVSLDNPSNRLFSEKCCDQDDENSYKCMHACSMKYMVVAEDSEDIIGHSNQTISVPYWYPKNPKNIEVKVYHSKIATANLITSANFSIKANTSWKTNVLKRYGKTLKIHYRRLCGAGFYGDQCEIVCQPRGNLQCDQNGNSYCLSGWFGPDCTEARCDCNEIGGYCLSPDKCQCHPGWSGPRCDRCKPSPFCLHGFCRKPFECICTKSWRGAHCDYKVGQSNSTKFSSKDYCRGIHCMNGAVCRNLKGTFKCECSSDRFAGVLCERRQASCTNATCSGRGKCRLDETGIPLCQCIYGWTGRSCEEPYDLCSPNPCLNNGTCNLIVINTTISTYKCACTDKFYGPNCEFSNIVLYYKKSTDSAQRRKPSSLTNVSLLTTAALVVAIILMVLSVRRYQRASKAFVMNRAKPLPAPSRQECLLVTLGNDQLDDTINRFLMYSRQIT